MTHYVRVLAQHSPATKVRANATSRENLAMVCGSSCWWGWDGYVEVSDLSRSGIRGQLLNLCQQITPQFFFTTTGILWVEHFTHSGAQEACSKHEREFESKVRGPQWIYNIKAKATLIDL